MRNTFWTELLGCPFKLDYVTVNGLKTRVLLAGEGDPLVLLHGTGGHLEAYIRNVVAHARHFRVIIPDLLGHGFTEGPAGVDYTIPLYVDHVKGLLDALGLEAAHLSGESLGGWIAAWLAAEAPERVKRLVLNTAGGLTADPEVMQRLYTLSKQAMTDPTRDAVRKRLEWLMHDPAVVTEELIDTRFQIYQLPKIRASAEQILCLQKMDIRRQNLLTPEQLGRITAPTLVLWTSHDPSADLSVAHRFVEYIPGSKLVVIEGCGHWPQFEAAAEFNRIHLDFLLDR